MTQCISYFSKSESGAATVDWAVITAAVVGLGLAAMGVIRGSVAEISEDINSTLHDDVEITTTFNN